MMRNLKKRILGIFLLPSYYEFDLKKERN